MEAIAGIGGMAAGIGGAGILGIAAIMSLFQLAPIKVNPWTRLFKWIGKSVNEDVMVKLETQHKDVESLKAATDELAERVERKDAEDARNHILRFGDEVKNKVRHSQEYFNQILDDITKYEAYCRSHPDFKNERTAATEAIIREVYKKCVEENDFL